MEYTTNQEFYAACDAQAEAEATAARAAEVFRTERAEADLPLIFVNGWNAVSEELAEDDARRAFAGEPPFENGPAREPQTPAGLGTVSNDDVADFMARAITGIDRILDAMGEPPAAAPETPAPEHADEDAPPADPVDLVEHNGWLSDPETGVVYGRADLPRRDFRVETPEDANYVTGLFLDVDTEIAAQEAKMAALMEHQQRILNERLARREFLTFRWGEQLRAFAEAQLANHKGKKAPGSVKTDYATLAFHKAPDSISVADQLGAKTWAKTDAPWALKTETVETVLVFELKGFEHLLPAQFFNVVGPGKNFEVKTGVQITRKKGAK